MKKQLLAFLASMPLAIEKIWLQSLIDTIRSVGDTKQLDPELLKALVIDPGEPAGDKSRATVRGSTGIISLNGPIFPKPNILTEWLGIGTALDHFMQDIKALQEDDSIERTLIVADSPGGSITGINEAANLLSLWGKNKPIDTYTVGANCSACYWLTSSAGKIYADATARIGSIGVLATFYKDEDDHSIEIVNSKSPKKALKASSKEGQAEILKTIDAIADVFIGAVAEARGVSEQTVVNDFGQGGVLVGREAETVKMIDGLSSFEKILSEDSTEKSSTHSFTMKGESTMTLEELKAKFPDVFKAAFDEGVASIQATLENRNQQIQNLEGQVTTLEGQLEAAGTENASLNTRLTALERDNEIQKAKTAEAALKAQADGIFKEALAVSDLPVRLHAKVQKMVDYNAHCDDKGVLNVETFKAAIEKEIGEWTSALDTNNGQPNLSGLTPQGNSDEDGADDDVVNRMLASAGVKVE